MNHSDLLDHLDYVSISRNEVKPAGQPVLLNQDGKLKCFDLKGTG